MTPEGKSWLTVPVKHKTGQLIYEVEISDPQWQRKHWERIKQVYKKAPFFSEYATQFEAFYLGTTKLNLSDANVSLIKIINEILGIKTELLDSRRFTRDHNPSERLLHIVRELGGSKYLSGPSAKTYLDETIFETAGIELSYMDYSNYPNYPQRSEVFAHDVSVLDLIFNCGPKATSLMKSFIP